MIKIFFILFYRCTWWLLFTLVSSSLSNSCLYSTVELDGNSRLQIASQFLGAVSTSGTMSLELLLSVELFTVLYPESEDLFAVAFIGPLVSIDDSFNRARNSAKRFRSGAVSDILNTRVENPVGWSENSDKTRESAGK